jgi:outer membrane protein assembly factor BamB
MNRKTRRFRMSIDARTLVFVLVALAASGSASIADDWPMWRRDVGRGAESAAALPAELPLMWVRDFPPLKPAYREPRLQFDAGYEPVVSGKSMFVASSFNDSVTALDTETGAQRWRSYAEGPVRFAPAVWNDRVFFGADDGHLYCVAADDGRLLWKFQAAPSSRRVMGNGRLISLWPVRGGPVLADGKIYFAAGVWPMEGVFIYCLDAETGKLVWRNDESSFIFGQHPHAAESLGGVTPQGYLVINGDELIVPCGQAFPARFDLQTGKLISFELPKPGRLPGGWFASAAVRRGEVTLDADINRDLHEDKTYQGPGSPGVRTTITVGGKKFRFADGFPGVEGDIHTMLAADGKLFVVTAAGRIYCFGSRSQPAAIRHGLARLKLLAEDYPVSDRLRPIVEDARRQHGYAIVWGAQNFESLASLLVHTELQLVVIVPDAKQVDGLRRQLDEFGVYGQRIALHVGSSHQFPLPPYMASIVIVDDAGKTFGPRWLDEFRSADFEALRPYGGTAMLRITAEEHIRFKDAVERHKSAEDTGSQRFEIQRRGEWTFVRREGPLPDAVNYTGGWSSPDQRVRAPLGVLWFDDTLGHFKRSPQPWFLDGVMVSFPKDWMEKHLTGRQPPYKLLPAVLSDVYTGRVLAADEAIAARVTVPERDLNEPQPNQYRPPTQRDDWKPEQPIAGQRLNPLTGENEPRAIPKSYGCDGGVDYGLLYTMRSGTPAFYDKTLESGVCSISGPRSGCTNSIIPACGVLNVPYFYEGCTCSYPLPVGLALVSMPPEHEQWSSWGPGKAENVQRVGINFGAPGDRMTAAGTLWLDYPNRGGPSPDVQVRVEPESATYHYRHSLWIRGGTGWPWVAASGVTGARTITIAGLKPGTFTVRLYFAEIDHAQPGQRVFDIALNNRTLRENFDILAAASGNMRSTVLQFDQIEVADQLRIALAPRQGEPLLSGIELVADGLELDPVRALPKFPAAAVDE